MYLHLAIRKNRKTYYATVSSFSYNDNNLWLYVWGDENNDGNCGYIPNGKVISACVATIKHPVMSEETQKIVSCWNI